LPHRRRTSDSHRLFHPPASPVSIRPACACRSSNRVLRLPATERTPCDLRRGSILRPRFRINRRLSSATNLRRLPTCADCRLSPTADLRRLPTFRRRLPTQPPTDIGCQIQRPAILLISGLRLRPTLRPNLPANPQLALPPDLPAPPFDRPATVAACRSSGHAFR